MDRDESAHKFIFYLLNFLLLMGAIACVLTIDHGRWLTSNPAFYDSSAAGMDASSSSQPATPCVTTAELPNSGWDSSYLMLNAYYNTVGAKTSNLPLCGK